jgi:Family of unknown function (DUF6283)
VTEQARRSPCPSCPYRRAAPSGIWDASEYTRLTAYDGEIGDQAMAGAVGLFACHSTPDRLCAGWLGHRFPGDLLAVRLGLADGRLDEAIIDYRTDVELWPSGAEAAAHGLRDLTEPGAAAREAIAKIVRLRPDVI